MYYFSSSISKQVVAGGSMIDIPTIKTLNHKLPREPEVLAHAQRLLIDILGAEVLSDAAIVSI